MDVYDSIIHGLNEAIEYEKGNIKAKKIRCTVNPVPEFTSEEIKSIRNELSMTQSVFAAVLGVSVKTVEAWETGTNVPSGTARRMIGMLREDPTIPTRYNIVSSQ
jgi:putative transcriptional regulator